jgi:hypothetical protein
MDKCMQNQYVYPHSLQMNNICWNIACSCEQLMPSIRYEVIYTTHFA